MITSDTCCTSMPAQPRRPTRPRHAAPPPARRPGRRNLTVAGAGREQALFFPPVRATQTTERRAQTKERPLYSARRIVHATDDKPPPNPAGGHAPRASKSVVMRTREEPLRNSRMMSSRPFWSMSPCCRRPRPPPNTHTKHQAPTEFNAVPRRSTQTAGCVEGWDACAGGRRSHKPARRSPHFSGFCLRSLGGRGCAPASEAESGTDFRRQGRRNERARGWRGREGLRDDAGRSQGLRPASRSGGGAGADQGRHGEVARRHLVQQEVHLPPRVDVDDGLPPTHHQNPLRSMTKPPTENSKKSPSCFTTTDQPQQTTPSSSVAHQQPPTPPPSSQPPTNNRKHHHPPQIHPSNRSIRSGARAQPSAAVAHPMKTPHLPPPRAPTTKPEQRPG